jgi:hypothetical protein
MDAIQGTVKNGQIIPDHPLQWPDGFRVRIEPEEEIANGDDDYLDSDDPAAIARWIAEFDAIPPWEMTPAEEAEWQAARQAMKEYTIRKMEQRFAKEQP